MPLNFICRIITLEQILHCSFSLNKTEILVLKHLLYSKEEETIEEIIKHVKKDRTTIQRSVKKLHEKDLIKRRQLNLEKGGYVFIYSSKPKQELKDKVKKIFHGFEDMVDAEIQKW
ncbi:MAG: helix-turn-helix domain-containing protein [Candidatus Woesearchaeota archaeon]